MRPAAMRCLRELAADEECDIIRERGTVFCGDTRIASRTLDELLCATAVSRINASHGIELFVLNSTGRAILRRPELADEITAAILSNQGPFTIRDDRVCPLDGQQGE